MHARSRLACCLFALGLLTACASGAPPTATSVPASTVVPTATPGAQATTATPTRAATATTAALPTATTAPATAPLATGAPRPTATAVPTSAPATASTAPLVRDKIRHIIVIRQENRSFDEYFGTYPGADGIPN